MTELTAYSSARIILMNAPHTTTRITSIPAIVPVIPVTRPDIDSWGLNRHLGLNRDDHNGAEHECCDDPLHFQRPVVSENETPGGQLFTYTPLVNGILAVFIRSIGQAGGVPPCARGPSCLNPNANASVERSAANMVRGGNDVAVGAAAASTRQSCVSSSAIDVGTAIVRPVILVSAAVASFVPALADVTAVTVMLAPQPEAAP